MCVSQSVTLLNVAGGFSNFKMVVGGAGMGHFRKFKILCISTDSGLSNDTKITGVTLRLGGRNRYMKFKKSKFLGVQNSGFQTLNGSFVGKNMSLCGNLKFSSNLQIKGFPMTPKSLG